MRRRAAISIYLMVLLALAGSAASLASSSFVSYRRDGLRREARVQAHELALAAAALGPEESLQLGQWRLRREGVTSLAEGPLAACRLQWAEGRVIQVRYPEPRAEEAAP